MNYNLTDFTKLENVYIGDYFTEYDIQRVLDVVEEDLGFSKVSTDFGASKYVLLPKEADYVIKIPFTGTDSESGCYSYCSGFDDEYDTYTEFQGALGNGWNYCEAELLIYNEAKKMGIGEFFAETVLGGHCGDHPYYFQEKVDVYNKLDKGEEDWDKEEVDKSKESCKQNGYYVFNPYWISDCYHWYGEEKFCKFMDYLEAEELNRDLHGGNVGYSKIDGRPILLDFSGFND